MVVVVVVSHAGETPDERPEAAGEGLPLASLDELWFDVGINWRVSIEIFVDIVISEHHGTCLVGPVWDGIVQNRAMGMLLRESSLCS